MSSYDRIDKLLHAAPDGARLDARFSTASGREGHARLEACGPGMIRVRLSLSPLEDRRKLMVVRHEWPETVAQSAASEQVVSLATPRMGASLQKDAWRLAFTNAAGGELLGEERGDYRAFAMGLASVPFGFVDAEDGIRSVVGSFAMAPDEQFYGFGEKFGPIAQRGRVVASFNRGAGTWTEGEHKNVPLVLSSRGYGVYFNTSYPVLFNMGAKSNATWCFAVAEPELDFYVIDGPSYKEILARYTELTGRPKLPPRWSFGIWMSRHTYSSQSEVEQIASRFREEKLPCDVIKMDTGWFHKPGRGSLVDFDMEWNEQGFPDPAGMMKTLRGQGFHTCLFVNAWVLSNSRLAHDARKHDFLVKQADGSEHTWDMGPQCPVVAFDLTNPACRKWYQEQLTVLLRQGASTFFCDWGVDTPIDRVYAGYPGLEYSNLHSLLYNKTIYEAVEQHAGGPAVVWGIAGWAGSQRYPGTYGGDSRCTFRDMANVLRGGLSAAMSGIGFWGCDIGGFGRVQTGGPSEALYIRYLQHGMLLPLAEFHGIGAREPWHYGDRAVQVYRRYAQTRYRLLPYLYSQMYLSCRDGIPLLRPMVLEFQDDRNCEHLDLQYMLGDSLLVAPVFGEETRRCVYLPAGYWYDYWTKEAVVGGRWIEVDAPLDTMPLFVRGGRILPLGPEMDYVEQRSPGEALTLEVYAGETPATGLLYHDGREWPLASTPDNGNVRLPGWQNGAPSTIHHRFR
jgi:alpha-D-xyloside xylohydrolase